MNITGMVANASVIVNENHTDGQVKFNITAFDLAGNSLAVNQTRLNSSNLTIDKNVPSVTNLTLYSNNSNSSLAKAGDLINITLEVSENIYNATLEILNTTINMTESNNTAYANISVTQNSTNGLVEFNITAYDGAGNQFNISQSIASANVIIDTVNPESSNLTIYSNNSRTDYAMAGHLLNITITADETLKNANITILNSTYVMDVNGTVANASVNVYENSTKARYYSTLQPLILQETTLLQTRRSWTHQNLDQNSAEGDVLFNITAFDLAGNNFTADQTELGSSNVIIDHSIPSVHYLNVTSNNSNSSLARAGDLINITLQVSEQIENSTLQILNDSITMIVNNDTASATVTVFENSTNGFVEFNITAYDKTGNVFNVTEEDITSNNTIIDTNYPSLANLTIYSNNSISDYAMAGHMLNITITANETLKGANITILGSTYVMDVNGTVANASVNVYSDSTEGEVSFNITAFDLAGNNLTTNQTQLNSSNVIIDNASPMLENLTIYSNNTNISLATINNNLSITITANETLKNANITILALHT